MERISEWAGKKYELGLISESDFSNPDRLRTWQEFEPVAFHEEGHAGVARFFGWSIGREIVSSSTSGLTEAIPGTSRSNAKLILENIAISAGGEMAEEMCGITDHSGCGFDRGKQRFLAGIYQLVSGTNQSIGSIISEQRSRARGALTSIGFWSHQQGSIMLLRASTG